MRFVIVGAGVFGSSLAWTLARSGHDVVLVDQFEPGDPRSTSGGETRLLRSSHGPDREYPAMARRARTLWRELEAETGAELLVECGVAWIVHREDGWEADSEAALRELGIPVERVAPDQGLLPGMDPDGVAYLLLEPEAGVLRAQRATETLARAAREHGARIVRGRAEPDGSAVRLGGEVLDGDRVIWACGGWLGRLFPRALQIETTQQDLYFFEAGREWRAAPAWVDFDEAMYGTGDIDDIGVKVAPDTDGPHLEPDADLPPTRAGTELRAREFLAERFPDLAAAPLRSSRSCRYELSPDSQFICAPLPEDYGVWLMGGGSGHGFKHGPALAEKVAAALVDGERLPERFALGDRVPGRSLRTAGWRHD
jgi:glycine/D-amino acid oxidase-like deaminating enzyme